MAFDKNKILSRAQKLIGQGKLPKAIEEYQKIVDEDPADVRTHLKIGDLHAKLGNIEAATDTYRKVAEHYAKDGFFLKAIAVFKQILKLDPGMIKVYMRLAELYNQLGLNSEAMKQYQIVVKHYENKGMKKESLDVLQKMADLDPDNIASKVKLAELYAKEGFHDQAIQQFDSVASELKEKNNFEDLIKVLEKMSAMNPEDQANLKELSSIYLKVGEPKKALAKLQICFKANPKDSETLELLAQAFVDLQQPEKAKSVYKELAAVYEERGMIEDKEAVLAKMKEALPEEAYQSSQASYVEDSVSESAQSAKDKDLLAIGEEGLGEENRPDSTSQIISETDVYLKYGLVDKALDNIVRGLELLPGDPAIGKKLATILSEEAENATLRKTVDETVQRLMDEGKSDLVEIIRKARSGEPLTPEEPEPVREEVVEEVEEEIIVSEEAESSGAISIGIEEAPPVEAVDEAQKEPRGPKIEFPEDVSQDKKEELSLELTQVPDDLEEGMLREEQPSANIDLSSFEVKEPQEPQVSEDMIDLSPEPQPSLSGEEQIEPSSLKPTVSELPREVSQRELSKTPFSKYKDEVEEAEFFVKQGLLEEAKYIYESIVEAEPGFTEAKAKLDEIQALLDKDIKSKVKSKVSVLQAPPSETPQPSKTPGGEEFFDLSKELESEIQDLNKQVAESEEENVLTFEEMFNQFKQGVEKTLSKDDYEAHYDLGVAYKEMGLLDDSVGEFKIAMGNSNLRVNSISMIGICHLVKGDYDKAIETFEAGLSEVDRESEAGLSFLFDMAQAFYKKEDFEKALALLREIRSKRMSFRDVTQKINEIEAFMAEKAKSASGKSQEEEGDLAVSLEKDEDDDDDEGESSDPDKKDKISYI